MKKRDLERHLAEHGCQLLREGGSHSIWVNPQPGHKEAIPRHNEVKKHLARKICRAMNIEVPKGGLVFRRQLSQI